MPDRFSILLCCIGLYITAYSETSNSILNLKLSLLCVQVFQLILLTMTRSDHDEDNESEIQDTR